MSTKDRESGSAKPKASDAGDAGAAEVQAKMDEATEKGYIGTATDPTPNENYTVAGDQLPTPETDEALAEAAYKTRGPWSDEQKARRGKKD